MNEFTVEQLINEGNRLITSLKESRQSSPAVNLIDRRQSGHVANTTSPYLRELTVGDYLGNHEIMNSENLRIENSLGDIQLDFPDFPTSRQRNTEQHLQPSDFNLSRSLLASPQRAPSSSTLTQLNWLIDGLPEMYDEGDADMEGGLMDDLAIEKLINEGGRPPSQLVFPSLHRMSQLIMDRLQGAKCLVVTFSHIFVYSGRYGVRKHCSRLVVRPPVGCDALLNEPEAIVLDLPELLDRGQYLNDDADLTTQTNRNSPFSSQSSSSASASIRMKANSSDKDKDRVKKRSSLGVGADAFFVGEMELNRTITFPIKDLSDAVLQGWLRGQEEGGGSGSGSSSGSGRGCLRIDLESHITPPYKGVSVQANVRTYILTVHAFSHLFTIHHPFIESLVSLFDTHHPIFLSI
jgi:hypothetical protein